MGANNKTNRFHHHPDVLGGATRRVTVMGAWLLIVLWLPLFCMDISTLTERTSVDSDFAQYVGQLAAVNAHAQGIPLDVSDIEEPSLPSDTSNKAQLCDMEYVQYLQQKSQCIHKFLDKYAQNGTTFRKSLDKAALSSDSSEGDSRNRPRSLSKTDFNELLDIIGKACAQMEDKHAKKKHEAKTLRKVSVSGTAIGSCAGAFAGACVTAIVAAIITTVINL